MNENIAILSQLINNAATRAKSGVKNVMDNGGAILNNAIENNPVAMLSQLIGASTVNQNPQVATPKVTNSPVYQQLMAKSAEKVLKKNLDASAEEAYAQGGAASLIPHVDPSVTQPAQEGNAVQKPEATNSPNQNTNTFDMRNAIGELIKNSAMAVSPEFMQAEIQKEQFQKELELKANELDIRRDELNRNIDVLGLNVTNTIFGIADALREKGWFTSESLSQKQVDAATELFQKVIGSVSKPKSESKISKAVEKGKSRVREVTMISPDGVPGTVPENMISDYISAGYKRAE